MQSEKEKIIIAQDQQWQGRIFQQAMGKESSHERRNPSSWHPWVLCDGMGAELGVLFQGVRLTCKLCVCAQGVKMCSDISLDFINTEL